MIQKNIHRLQEQLEIVFDLWLCISQWAFGYTGPFQAAGTRASCSTRAMIGANVGFSLISKTSDTEEGLMNCRFEQ